MKVSDCSVRVIHYLPAVYRVVTMILCSISSALVGKFHFPSRLENACESTTTSMNTKLNNEWKCSRIAARERVNICGYSLDECE